MTRFQRMVLVATLGCVLGGDFFFNGRGLAAGRESLSAAWDSNDPYLWLEEIDSPEAMSWVRAHNEKTMSRFTADPWYAGIEADARQILLAEDRIPTPVYFGGNIYNFWQDGAHVRGIWRRTTVEEYRKNDPKWELLLDMDALSAAENENWVWIGADCLPPRYERCLIYLSRGGKDAKVTREFDLEKKAFIPGGFVIPESKSNVNWLDQDHLLVGTDWGAGSLTTSGYSRLIKLWDRGTPLDSARLIYRVPTSDVRVTSTVYYRPEGKTTVISRSKTFFTTKYLVLREDLSLQSIPIPEDADILDVYRGNLIIHLREKWSLQGRHFPEGALLSIALKDLGGTLLPKVIFSPDARSSVAGAFATKEWLYVNILQNVTGRLLRFGLNPAGEWAGTSVPLPDNGTVSVLTADPLRDSLFAAYESFLTPTSVYLIGDSEKLSELRMIRKLGDRFDSRGMLTEQFEAVSADGTSVPYFVIHKSGIPLNGGNPTLLWGYGGFEISYTPSYLQIPGKVWLEKGGVYVLANIRGGGEFGPKWHEAALKENRQKAFDDFIAVAEDLMRRGFTSPRRLGIMGGSNGGLLMGAVFVQRPELFGAVVCQVPLLDMLRFHKLLAGASWIAEYGDPEDPRMREAILKYSPYQNVKPGVKYPRVFFETSTQDDRVHPGHARKMVAKMEAQGHEVLYFENTEGGHSAAANLEQRARRVAQEYTYLFAELLRN